MYPTSTMHLLQYLTTFNYLPSRVLQIPQNGYHSSTLRQLTLSHITFTPPIISSSVDLPIQCYPNPILFLALLGTVFSRIPITTSKHRVMTSNSSIPQIIHPCYFQYFLLSNILQWHYRALYFHSLTIYPQHRVSTSN